MFQVCGTLSGSSSRDSNQETCSPSGDSATGCSLTGGNSSTEPSDLVCGAARHDRSSSSDCNAASTSVSSSLQRNGPMASVGSAKHPDACNACAFYCFTFAGCRHGVDCAYCHLAHESKVRQRRTEWKKDQRQKRKEARQSAKQRIETASLGIGRTRQVAEEHLGKPATSPFQHGTDPIPCQVPVVDRQGVGPAAVTPVFLSTLGDDGSLCDRKALPHSGIEVEWCSYQPSFVAACVGERLELWPPLGLVISGMVFAVAPVLPEGLLLDEFTGRIHGALSNQVPSKSEFCVTAAKPCLNITRVRAALVTIQVKEATRKSLAPSCEVMFGVDPNFDLYHVVQKYSL
uniref:C3H1-type domain-containing protein n=1 Tax=Noctiluca scintillans TaxID=2966 RepID=A0A7S1FCE4_NOCSC|mmetsp:Transcript_52374/g.139443  ORF Transcript_52374/g.139443 Transcript_52374/m.139443 type:complete len:345 (+) Transcript_52374:47-1081(+)